MRPEDRALYTSGPRSAKGTDVAEGNAEYLAGRLQERYGWAKDRAEKEVREFQDSVSKDYPDYK